MKSNRVKLLSLLLIICLILPFTPIPLKVYATGFEDTSLSIANILTSTFTTTSDVDLFYVITSIDHDRLDENQITNPNGVTGVISSGTVTCVANMPTPISIDLNGLSLVPGNSYQIQAIDTDHITYSQKFTFGNISSAFSPVQLYSDGGLFTVTSQVSGTLYTKVVGTNENPDVAQMLSTIDYPYARHTTSIYKNTPHPISLRGSAIMPGDSYKLCALLRDQYGVVHTSIYTSTFTAMGNKLLSVYYDNGTTTGSFPADDDRIVLTFANIVNNPGDHSTYKIEFDNNSAVFQNADITLTNDINDFTVEASDNQVFLKLEDSVPGHGYQLFDDAATEFDNGVFRVTILNPNNTLYPKLDSSDLHPSCDQSLDHSIIALPDSYNIRLSSLVYNNNSTTDTKSDDYLNVTFNNDVTLPNGVEPFILNVDEDNMNKFDTADKTLVYGVDYNVDETSPTVKKIYFTATGINYLNTLDNATFRLSMANDLKNTQDVDPSIVYLYAHYLNDQIGLTNLIYNDLPLESVSTTTSTYNVNTSYRLYMDSVYSQLLKVVPESSKTAISVIDDLQTSTSSITLKAPSGDTRTYTVNIAPDPMSLKFLKLNGVMITGFNPLKTEYDITLPYGTSSVPTIDYDFENSDVVVSGTSPNSTGSLQSTLNYSLSITSNLGTKVFYLNFTVAANQQASYQDDSPITPTVLPNNQTPLAAQTEAAGIEQVNNASTALGTAASSNSENPTDPIVKALDSLTKIVETTYNNQGLTGVLTKLSDSLELVAKDMASPKVDDTKVLKEVTDITKAVEGQLGALTNPESALKLVTEYIQAVKLIKDAGRLNTPALDQSVEDILTSTSQRLGTVKLDTPKVDEKGLIVEPEDVNSTIQRQLGFVSQIQNLSDQYFDDSQSRKIVTEITLKLDLPKETENFDVTFKAATVDSLTKSKIEKFSLEINGSKITIPTTDANSKTDLKIIMNFEDTQSGRNGQFSQPELPLAEQQLPKDQQIVDFTVYENNQRVELFQKPIRLTFQLEQFKLQNEDPNTLTILRYDENLRTWSPVGGIVDPDLEIIFVDRSTLSQYTVMKSKKTLSQADQSWAKAEINAMLNKGIIAETTTFAPTALVTRAEFAAWIAKAYGLKDSGKALGFKDVSKTNPNYAAIQAVCQQGIMGGKSKTQFDPNGNLTTEEMAVMVGKVLVLFDDKKSSDKVKSKYLAELKTNQVASWATGDMSLLMELGISKSASLADGKALVTKEVAAAVLMGAYQS